MIDFTNLPKRNKAYAGANGNKISVVYNNELYMLKFPPHPTKNFNMGYSNSCISEYLGCKIFESIGIQAQEVMLGTYTTTVGGTKIVVACKDFTAPGKVLQDFASLKNQMIDSIRNGYGTELSDILLTIEQQVAMDVKTLSDHFWDMFIVDAFIGNWDRHNGNWGFLYDYVTDEISLAPVFDCGSSLFPQADEVMIPNILADKNAVNHRIFNIPLSAITQDGKKINYFKFISSLENRECNQALKRILPGIDMQKINTIIEEIPCISDVQKEFYKTMLTERKEHILDFSMQLIHKRERQRKQKH